MTLPTPDAGARGEFICPACGESEPPAVAANENSLSPEDPWGGVIPYCTCATCGRAVPQHLAERWHGLSPQEAAAEWRQLYQ